MNVPRKLKRTALCFAALGMLSACGVNTSTARDFISGTLPADLLLRPKAANCASLASASYRLIKMAPSPGSTLTAFDIVDFDAPTLTYRRSGTTTVLATLIPNGNCRYSIGSDVDIVVSPAGVIVARSFIGFDEPLWQ